MTRTDAAVAEAHLAPVVRALQGLAFAQRHLHPALLDTLAERLAPLQPPLAEAQAALEGHDSAAHRAACTAAGLTLRGLRELAGVSSADPDGIHGAYRAVRYVPWAMELLYPLRPDSAAVTALFTLDGERGGTPPAPAPAGADGGVHHFDNERGSRGGHSVYVPEQHDGTAPMPVVIALHGGAGHGRAFLWTWLTEARARGALLVSPTCTGDTWSLMAPEVDGERLVRILDGVAGRWPVDRTRVLLTGMSDGGTFTYLGGLRAGTPYTHLAPVSACFHPMLLELLPDADVRGRPVHVTHGVHDWMFPVDSARLARDTLSAMGARLVYREIADLAHTYPREVNIELLDWLAGDDTGAA